MGTSWFAALLARHRWLDHLVKAGSRYAEKHGDHYAAAITYFSVLALVPILMIAFAAAGYVLAGDPQLLTELRDAIAGTVPPTLVPMVVSIIDTAVAQRDAVGVFGLVLALYAGLGWTANLREALSEQWDQRMPPPPVLRRYGSDLLAMIGLALALVASFAITVVATGMSGTLIDLLGVGGGPWVERVVVGTGPVLGLLANWVVLVWVIARLPREPITLRSAVRAAALGAVGLALLQQVMAVYLAAVTTSPAGVAFGPILGLLVFTYVVSRLVLFVTAWAATLRENEPEQVHEPAPVVVRPEITVRGRPGPATTAALLGAGVAVGVVVGTHARRTESRGAHPAPSAPVAASAAAARTRAS